MFFYSVAFCGLARRCKLSHCWYRCFPKGIVHSSFTHLLLKTLLIEALVTFFPTEFHSWKELDAYNIQGLQHEKNKIKQQYIYINITSLHNDHVMSSKCGEVARDQLEHGTASTQRSNIFLFLIYCCV